METRPDYVLKLADGREIVFKPMTDKAGLWRFSRTTWSITALEALGATPVEPEPEPVVYTLIFTDNPRSSKGDAWNMTMTFRSREDAENWLLRVQSIAPEWTGWEPEERQEFYELGFDGSTRCREWDNRPSYQHVRLDGFAHPTKERAEKWLAKFGKAWGLR